MTEMSQRKENSLTVVASSRHKLSPIDCKEVETLIFVKGPRGHCPRSSSSSLQNYPDRQQGRVAR